LFGGLWLVNHGDGQLWHGCRSEGGGEVGGEGGEGKNCPLLSILLASNYSTVRTE
jgi:hypothetical protein